MTPPADPAGAGRGVVWIGLPAYNEEAALGPLLDDLHRVLAAAARDHRLLVVDDGSTDGTRALLERAAARLPVTAVHHPENRNLGGAMRTLFATFRERAGGDDVLVCMDADNTFRADQLPALLAAVDQGADLVVASRYVPGGGMVGVPWHRRLMSFTANRLFRLLLPLHGVTEYTCSFRAYAAGLLQAVVAAEGPDWIREDGFTCMPEILVRVGRHARSVRQVPVCIRYDLKAGRSKMRVARNVFATLALLGRLRRRPRAPQGR